MRSNIDPSSCILVEDAKVIAADDQMARDSTASVQTPTEGKLILAWNFFITYAYLSYFVLELSTFPVPLQYLYVQLSL